MFKKLGKAFGGGKASNFKVKFDLQVVQVERLPQSVRKCRVVWARSAKVQMTAMKDVRNGVAQFKQTLTQVASLTKGRTGDYEPKEYQIKVQVPGSSSNDMVTIGKANLDMVTFVSENNSTYTETVPMSFKFGTASTNGFVKVVVTSTSLGDMSEDGMTEVSGMTGLTSDAGNTAEQDLEGFDDSPNSKPGKDNRRGTSESVGMTKRPLFGSKGSLPTTKEETSENDDSEDESNKRPLRPGAKGAFAAGKAAPGRAAAGEGSGADLFSKKGPGASKLGSKPSASKWQDDDDDISPVASDLSDEEDARPPPKKPGEVTRGKASAKPPEPEMDLSDLKSALFGKKGSTTSISASTKAGSSATAAKGKTSKPADEVDEESARSALFSSKVKPGKATPAKSPTPPPPAADSEDEDSARNALFSTTSKKATGGSGKLKPPARKTEDDEDASRNALFSTTTAKRSAAGKASPAPPPEVDSEDEDAARNALFSSSSKKPGAASGGKPGAAVVKGAGKTVAAPHVDSDDDFDEDSARNNLFSSSKNKKPGAPQKSSSLGFDDDAFAPAPSKSNTNLLDKWGNAASRPGTTGNAKKGGRYDDSEQDSEGHSEHGSEDELGVAKPAARSGILGPPVARQPSKQGTRGAAAVSPDELIQVQAEADRLRGQVSQLQQREQQLTQELAQAEKTIQQLEDKLEKVHVELQDTQAQQQNQMEELSQKHQKQVKDLEDQLQELETALDEAEQQLRSKPDLSAREAQLAKLEAQAAAKMAEADKMVDESMLVAVKNQQEKKALEDEIQRLRDELAKPPAASKARGISSAAASRKPAKKGYDFEDDEGSDEGSDDDHDAEIEKLRSQIQELQLQNQVLQKQSQAAQQAQQQLLGSISQVAGVTAVYHGLQEDRSNIQDTVAAISALDAVRVELEGKQQELDASRQSHAAAATAWDQERSHLMAKLETVQADSCKLQDEVVSLVTQLHRTPSMTRIPSATSGQAPNITTRNEKEGASSVTPSKHQLGFDSTDDESPFKQRKRNTDSVGGESADPVAVRDLTYQLKQAKKAAETNQAALREEVRVLVEELQQANAALSGVDELRADLQALRQENLDLAKQRDELQVQAAEFADAEAIVKEWSDYADALKADKEALESKLKEVQAELVEKSQQLEDAAAQIETLNGRLSAASARRQSEAEQERTWETKALSLQVLVDQLQSDLGAKTRSKSMDTERLRSDLAQAKAQNESLNASLHQSEAAVLQAQTELEHAQTGMKSLQADLNATKADLKAARADLAESVRTQEELEQQNNALKSQVTEVVELKEQLQALQAIALETLAASPAAAKQRQASDDESSGAETSSAANNDSDMESPQQVGGKARAVALTAACDSTLGRRGWSRKLEAVVAENQALRVEVQHLRIAIAAARRAVDAAHAETQTQMCGAGNGSNGMLYIADASAGYMHDRHSTAGTTPRDSGSRALSEAGHSDALGHRASQPLITELSPIPYMGQGTMHRYGAQTARKLYMHNRDSMPGADHGAHDSNVDQRWNVVQNVAASPNPSEASNSFMAYPSHVLPERPSQTAGNDNSDRTPGAGGAADMNLSTMPVSRMAALLSESYEKLADAQAEVSRLKAVTEQASLLRATASVANMVTSSARPSKNGAPEPVDSQQVVQLKDQVRVLTDWRCQAESTLAQLQAEQTILKVDRAEALDSAQYAQQEAQQIKDKLGTRDATIQRLQAELDQLARDLDTANKQLALSHDVTQTKSSGAPSNTSSAIKTAVDDAHPPPYEDVIMGRSYIFPHVGDSVPGALGSTAIQLQLPKLAGLSTAKTDDELADEILDAALPAGRVSAHSSHSMGRRSSGDAPLMFGGDPARLSAQLKTAFKAVQVTRKVICSCLSTISSKETLPVADNVDIDVALIRMKDEAFMLLDEIKLQARDAPRFEAQLAVAARRVVELEAQVHDLHDANTVFQRLPGSLSAGFTTPRSFVSTPPAAGGGPGANTSPFSHHAHPAAAGLSHLKNVYGDDAGLAISAVEQQLALAQAQIAEAQVQIERLEDDNVSLRQQLGSKQVTSSTATSMGNKAGSRGFSASRSPLPAADSDEESDENTDTRGKGMRAREALAAKRAAGKGKVPAEVQQEIDSLRAKISQLEDVLHEVESSAAAEQSSLQEQLRSALQQAEQAQAELQKALKDKAADTIAAGPGQLSAELADLRKQVTSLERRVARLQRENLALAEDLESERELRERFEEQIRKGLENMDDDDVLDTVEAFESKYSRMKDKYKKLEVASNEQLEEADAQLEDAEAKVAELQAQLARAQQPQIMQLPSRPQTASGTVDESIISSANSKFGAEVVALRRENDKLLTQLLHKQVEAAELAEEAVILRRDLHRAKEVNMKLASKMTTLEAQAFTGAHEKKRLFGRKKKDKDEMHDDM